MIETHVFLDIISSITEFEDIFFELWMYLRTLYQSNYAQRWMMLTKKLAIFKLRDTVTEQYFQTIQYLKIQPAAI